MTEALPRDPAELRPGTVLASRVRGPYTASHLVRWCAAQQNWDRIHYDRRYAVEHAHLPGPVINGALKQHLIAFHVAEVLGPGAWVHELDYRFTGPDVVGDALRVTGTVAGVEEDGTRRVVVLQVEILNERTGEPTTVGTVRALLNRDGTPVLDALDLGEAPADESAPPESTGEGLPEAIRLRIGDELEALGSYVPVEQGRLVLFADAVMDVPAHHFDVEAGSRSPWGTIVAPPLYPIHAMVARPGTRPLSTDPDAMGREGVFEIGRDLARIFGVPPTGLLNGGNRVRVHSLARVGETVRATSRLVAARRRTGRRGGDMLLLETSNRYETNSGRPLMTERQTTVFRLVG
jgi:acyl dehydratase